MLPRIHHVMLPVRDLDRSLAFYTALLGMQVRHRNRSTARQVDVGLVGYGDGDAVALELTQNLDAGASAVQPLPNHVGLHVSDLRGLCATLEPAGVRIVRPFKERGDGRGWTAWIADPDGHQLELVQLRDGES